MIVKKYLVLIGLLLTPSVLFAVELIYDPTITDTVSNNLIELSEQVESPPNGNSQYTKARLVGDINIELIAGSSEEIVVQLPNQPPLVALKRRDSNSQRLQKSGPIHSTWIGKLQNQQDSSVVISTFRGIISGRINFGSKIYEIKRNKGKDTAQGAYVIEEIDTEALPSCDAENDSLKNDQNSQRSTSTDGGIPERSSSAASEQGVGTVIIDLLAVYTTTARNSLGGTSGIQAHIISAMDNANVSFANSGMNIQFNMAHMEEVSYTESDSSTDLNWVVSDSTVASLRNTHNADMVSLITESNYCGRGYVQRNPGSSFAPLAFQVTDVDCAVGNLTFAHEHGHNMGMEHDPANGPSPANASYPYSFGHFVNGSYRSVMSYSSECTSGCSRAMYFSNPNVSYLGAPTGIANQRHNAQTGINTAPIVAAFRSSAGGSPDLIVESLGVSADSLEPGQPVVTTLAPGESFTTSATTRNQGNGSANATTLRYYVSNDSIIAGDDTQLSTDPVASLAAGNSESNSDVNSAPATEGNYWIGACVDAVTDESSTSNNCSAGTQIEVVAPAPDLIVESPSVSDSSLALGQSFSTSATVRNQGTETSNASTLRYYLSTNSVISTTDSQLGTDAVIALSVGSTENHSDTHAAPVSEGTFWVGACVDTVTDESNTSNNCSSGVQITVTDITDAYEPDDDNAGAKPIVNSETQLHSFHVAGDKDWMRFTLTQAVSNFRIETADAGYPGDTRLYLYDDQVLEIASDDDSGTGQFSKIELPTLQAGTYFILADEFNDDDVLDAYNIHMNFDPDSANQQDILDYLPAIISATRSSSAGSSCGDLEIYDCANQCVAKSQVEQRLGNGVCDSGGYGVILTCPAFNGDSGDCD